MNILAIETSCDETALSIISTQNNNSDSPQFKVLSDLVISQINIHAEYGGVFPALAKREHAKNLTPLLKQALQESGLYKETSSRIIKTAEVQEILEREPELSTSLIHLLEKIEQPQIDMIIVTHGPGLAPALWVGVNFARSLSVLWGIPVVPVNHMEGHITSILLKENYMDQDTALLPLNEFQFPMLSLLISGGHTQLVLIKDWGEYEIIGETIDDAVGEAFDKVARMLDMPYPGGPKISASAKKGGPNELITLPRPMIHSKDYRFSFSGLKTAALYLINKLKKDKPLDPQTISDVAYEFEHAVTEVLVKKTMRAIEEYGAQGLIIAGGVSANTFITKSFSEKIKEYGIPLYLPEKKLCGDNSLMIATAGFINYWKKHIHSNKQNLEQENLAIKPQEEIIAVGNLKL